MERGLFISLEGPDGSGKSTQIEFLKTYFEELGLPCVFTREPGGTPISEKIRAIILDKENSEMDDIYVDAKELSIQGVAVKVIKVNDLV